MRRIFTDFGTEEESKLFNQLKKVQDKIKKDRKGAYKPIALIPCNKEQYAIVCKLVEIYSLITSNDLKGAIKCTISFYNELKDTYNNTKVQS